jgi:hypothetical protein
MDITQTLIAATGVIGLLIGAVGGLSSARKDSVIKVLTQDNLATKAYNKTLVAENATLTAERDSFKVQADTFRSHVQATPQLKALTKAVENQTKVLTEYFGKQRKPNG